MKYFRWQPDFINTMSWANFMLYMSSIPQFDDDPKDKMEVKDAADIF